MTYTYKFTPPSVTPPFRSVIKRTRGQYAGTTEPQGPFGFRYAIFRNRASEILIPLHDLTPETKAAIAEVKP